MCDEIHITFSQSIYSILVQIFSKKAKDNLLMIKQTPASRCLNINDIYLASEKLDLSSRYLSQKLNEVFAL